ncbi:DUF58 domain-containing protein [Clostridium sp. 'White wine YQ']|uniref:DUF58 domain-containing protein n=1 Tax=Clostridium sp. 'White wine YQ' TaxID=3027474 RepID=UPI0023668B67|nr:DUF58 domain-containing protein [Clostridium sp. 'White wine YQ']MDD7792889.1 DUF58 domain-containing protein [Clostridium sp. 'White wine YQ']
MREDLFNEEFFKQLQNLKLILNTPISSGFTGGRRSREKGVSVEFSDYREYSPGDDFRRVDWNAYGRFNKLYLKLFMEEREAIFNIFIDTSKSMDYGVFNKAELALRLSGALSYMILNYNDRVKIHEISEEVKYGKINISGKLGVSKILCALKGMEFRGKSSLIESVKRADILGRGVSILISDFYNMETLRDTLVYLRHKKQEVILIQILSKEELEPSIRGDIKLKNIEDMQENLDISIYGKALSLYKEKLKDFKEEVQRISKKYGVKYIFTSSENSLEKIIFKELAIKGVINRG